MERKAGVRFGKFVRNLINKQACRSKGRGYPRSPQRAVKFDLLVCRKGPRQTVGGPPEKGFEGKRKWGTTGVPSYFKRRPSGDMKSARGLRKRHTPSITTVYTTKSPTQYRQQKLPLLPSYLRPLELFRAPIRSAIWVGQACFIQYLAQLANWAARLNCDTQATRREDNLAMFSQHLVEGGLTREQLTRLAV
ncbi:hypothetical protein KM043_005410 [Ampulex compressa]|nr:hypothetical protein KM043_005410 [Ampulex compressa]